MTPRILWLDSHSSLYRSVSVPLKLIPSMKGWIGALQQIVLMPCPPLPNARDP